MMIIEPNTQPCDPRVAARGPGAPWRRRQRTLQLFPRALPVVRIYGGEGSERRRVILDKIGPETQDSEELTRWA